MLFPLGYAVILDSVLYTPSKIAQVQWHALTVVKANPRGRPDRSQSLSPITAPEQYGRLWKAKSSHETCHLRLPLAASTEAAWACSASIRLISRRMRARLIRILSGLLLIRLAGLAVKGVCGRAISVPFPHAGQITRQRRLIGGRTLRAHASILGCEIPHEP